MNIALKALQVQLKTEKQFCSMTFFYVYINAYRTMTDFLRHLIHFTFCKTFSMKDSDLTELAFV